VPPPPPTPPPAREGAYDAFIVGMILGIAAALICLLGLCYLCDARERRDRAMREQAALISLRARI
jgi:hypothetical protein